MCLCEPQGAVTFYRSSGAKYRLFHVVPTNVTNYSPKGEVVVQSLKNGRQRVLITSQRKEIPDETWRVEVKCRWDK